MECSSMVSTHRFSRNIIHPSVESIRALSSSSWEEKNKKPGGTAAGQAHIAVALLPPGFLCIGISQVGRFTSWALHNITSPTLLPRTHI